MKRLTNAEKTEIHKQLEEAEKAKFKPYEDRIADLEKENANLKDVIEGYKKIAKWCDKCDKIAELEQKNAELKEQCSILADCNTCTSTCKTENIEMKKQLTKAKEIIKSLLRLWNDVMTEETVKALAAEAEQFISEVEK